MSKFKVTVFVFTLIHTFSFAQQPNFWYWGQGAGLDFSAAGNPVEFFGQPIPNDSREGTAVIGDANGDVLLFSDGITVFGADDNPLPNGTGLLGSYSSTQSVIIVPNPGNGTEYYVITTGEANGTSPDLSELHYSVVDISMNGGLGDIPMNRKNLMLADSVGEKLTYTFHSDKQTFWVASRRFDGFNMYRVGMDSLDNVAVFSPSTLQLSLDPTMAYDLGEMKFSADGTKLAAAFNINADSSGVEIYDFDKGTGMLSNPRILLYESGNTRNDIYGLEFSPSGRYLYMGHSNLPDSSLLFQLDLCLDSIGLTDSLKTTVFGLPGGGGVIPPFSTLGQLKLGEDGKIYIKVIVEDHYYVDVINNPEAPGDELVYLHQEYDFGQATLFSLRSFGFPQTYPYLLDVPDQVICEPNPLTLSVNPPFNDDQNLVISWSNGQTGASADFTEEGMYTVSVTNDCMTIIDTFMLNPPVTFPQAGDLLLCEGETIELSFESTVPVISAEWQDGSTEETFTATEPGVYFVTVTVSCGEYTDTFNIFGPDDISSDVLGPDAVLCVETTITLDATTPGGVDYTWNTGATTPSIVIDESGTYAVTIVDDCGNTLSDDILISDPVVSNQDLLGPDFIICSDDPVTVDATTATGTSYEWSTGATTAQIEISEAGTYAVTITDNCGNQVLDDVIAARATDFEFDLETPNAFSPDNDGLNDAFKLVPGEELDVTNFEIRIFNRWGQEVYTGNNIDQGWDGRYDGEPAVMDVYIYTARVTANFCSEVVQREYSGDITLIR